LYVVHNGIIENFEELKAQLRDSGHVFVSETDTEVIAHLIEEYNGSDLKSAVLKAVSRLEGSFAICVISKNEPDTLIGARKDSPLVAGIAEDGVYLASDSLALVPYTDKEICLQDGEIISISNGKLEICDGTGTCRPAKPTPILISSQDADKGEYEHYMLKEIYEQPRILRHLIQTHIQKDSVRLPDIGLTREQLKKVRKVRIVACGTAYHAGLVGKYLLEKIGGVDVEIDVSSEFRYRHCRIRKGDLVVAISQSGETADTLAAVKRFREQGANVISVCNVLGSSLIRVSDGYIHTASGPEIGVASTKAYTSQVLSLFFLALYWGQLKKTVSSQQRMDLLNELAKIPRNVQDILETSRQTVEHIAAHYSSFGCFLFLGRGLNYPTAMEGALKLKELSYIPAEGYAAGEMKHGPIALIDEYRAVVCVALRDSLYDKMFSNIQEIKARQGKVVALINRGDKKIKNVADEYIELPVCREECSPLLAAIPLQLLAYYIAHNLGYDIDKPRNLAKSVTVE